MPRAQCRVCRRPARGFLKRALCWVRSGAAVCVGPSSLAWASASWSPARNGTALLAVPPRVCGESGSLRRGPLGLMFNWRPPCRGTSAGASLSAGPAARPAADRQGTRRAAATTGHPRLRQPGWWQVAPCPGCSSRGAPGPSPATEGALTTVVCGLALSTPPRSSYPSTLPRI